MDVVWDTIQNFGKWWSKKEREAHQRMEARARIAEERELARRPNWEDHRG